MRFLMLYHLPSSLLAFVILFTWSTIHFDRTHLPRIILLSFINFLFILLLGFKNSKTKSEAEKLLVSASLNFVYSFVLFVIVILLTSVPFLSDIHGTLALAFLLSLLTVVPNLSGHFENGVLATNATDTSDWSETDKFALINVSTVLGASWLCSLCYGLNVRGELTHYPIASCTGAYIGSLLVNLYCITTYVQTDYVPE